MRRWLAEDEEWTVPPVLPSASFAPEAGCMIFVNWVSVQWDDGELS
jgi:hypothetical protein